MQSKISVQNLSIYYKDIPALLRVSMDIPAGKITSLVGPRGAGKSTLLRTLNRMADQEDGARVEGKILLDETDIYNGHSDIFALRKKVGMLFSKPEPFPVSIYENIALGLKLAGVKNRKELNQIVEASLHEVRLWQEVKDCLYRPAAELTAMQQQSLCLARILALKPEVLVMDEPASTLDPKESLLLEDIVLGLSGHYTVVIAAHDTRQAARVSDYTAFFLAGELVEFGGTGEIFTRPVDQRTEDYITERLD